MTNHQPNIGELTTRLCPKGVDYKPLGETVVIKNGKDWKSLASGNIPVYGTGGVMGYVDTHAYDKPTVLIPRKGSIENIFYLEEPFWNVDTIYYTEINTEIMMPKFFYYFLSTIDLKKLDTGSGRPSLTQAILNKIATPIPPLPIQEAIVDILDTFTTLEAELEAELEARRKQYEYYRDELLTHEHANGQWTTLGDVFTMTAGQHISASKISKVPTDDFPFPCYGGNGIRGFVTQHSHDGAYVLIGRQGALCGNVQRTKEKFYATEHAVVVTPIAEVDVNWAFHKLTMMNLNQYASKSAQPGLAVGRLKKVPIYLPVITEQQKISSTLDKFDALISDISIGLPAEIKARRQQYEYYRDKLLTFPEKACV